MMLGLGFIKGSFFGFLLGIFFKRFSKIVYKKKKSEETIFDKKNK